MPQHGPVSKDPTTALCLCWCLLSNRRSPSWEDNIHKHKGALRVPDSSPHPLDFHHHPLHKAAPHTSLRFVVPLRGEVSDELLAVLPHRIIGHTSIKVCDVVAVEVVTVDGANNMIHCDQTVAPQVSTFLHDYGGAGICSSSWYSTRESQYPTESSSHPLPPPLVISGGSVYLL